MGWFGSLQLAYKYGIVFASLLITTLIAGGIKVAYDRKQLQKHIKRESLEAVGVLEGVDELIMRELDEGDFFGVRAIESGYYGGVAQSRPTSAAGSHSPSGFMSNTPIGSHLSLKLPSTRPTSNVKSLPIIATQPSPLVPDPTKAPDIGVVISPLKRKPAPINSGLRPLPSPAELSGRINHEPAVNMSLNVTPSPGLFTRPSTSASASTVSSPSSLTISFSDRRRIEHYVPATPPRLSLPDDIRGSARSVMGSLQPSQEVKSRSASIISKLSSMSTPGQSWAVSPYFLEHWDFPTTPARAVRRHHPTLGGTFSERLSGRGGDFNAIINRPRGESVWMTVRKSRRVVSAVGEWGEAVLQEIDSSLEGSKLLHDTTSHRQHHQHSPSPSFVSSIFDVAQAAQRHASTQISIDPSSQRRSSMALSNNDPHPIREGRRPRNASSHLTPATSEPIATTSQRNTRESSDLFELYDLYWRHNLQASILLYEDCTS